MSTVKIEMRGGIDVLPRYASGCRLKIRRKKRDNRKTNGAIKVRLLSKTMNIYV